MADPRALARLYAPLGVLSGIWFLARFVRTLLPPLFPRFQELYGVGTAETGLIYSVVIGAYALMQFPSGAIADRVWRTLVITVGTAVAALAAVAMALAPTYPLLLVAAAVFGLGTGTHKTVALTIIGEIYPERQARAMGAMDAIGVAAGGLAPLVLVVLGALALDWRLAFGLAAVVGVVLAVLNREYVAAALEAGDAATHAGADADVDGGGTSADPDDTDAADAGPDDAESSIPDSDATPAPDGDGTPAANGDGDGDGSGPGIRAYLRTFRRPRFALFVCVSVLFVVTWTGVAAFLPLYLIEVKGFGESLANLLYGGVFGAALVQVVTGSVADRVGEVPVLVVGSLGTVAGLGALVAVGSVPAVVVAGGAFALAINAARPARSSYLVRTIPAEVGGGTLGIVRTAMIGTGSVMSAVYGFTADAAGLDVAFLGIVAAAALGAALMLVVAVLERRAAASGSGAETA
ncbi:MAG: sugar MFS transporter [Haloferacaceae archaeon]